MRIEREASTVVDTRDCLIENKNGITCGCGNPELKMVMHFDFTDRSQSRYVCQCGNEIDVVVERSEEEQAMWE